MTLKIYKIDGSPAVRAVLMTAEALKLNYETQNVNLMTGEHKKPEYLEKNPAHSVPLLEEDDFFLADSHAIITYLVSKYGDEQQSKLYPEDLRIRATIEQRMFYEATILYPATRTVVHGFLGGQKSPTPDQLEQVNASYEILEKYLQKTKFVACDHVTLADISCVASVSSIVVTVPVDDKYPKLQAWLQTLQEEDWYKKGNVPGLEAYEAFLRSRINKSA